jgi:mono/diheme cytochrome c family protein
MVSTVAVGLPWDIDLVDGQQMKAYSFVMEPPVAGTVPQAHIGAPRLYQMNYSRYTAEGKALKGRHPKNLELGERMFGIYCTPCHGDGIEVGPVGQPGRFPGVVPLAGPGGAAARNTDGYIYLTIRNGGAIMPNYGWAMSDKEMWSIVDHIRTLPNATQTQR